MQLKSTPSNTNGVLYTTSNIISDRSVPVEEVATQFRGTSNWIYVSGFGDALILVPHLRSSTVVFVCAMSDGCGSRKRAQARSPTREEN